MPINRSELFNRSAIIELLDLNDPNPETNTIEIKNLRVVFDIDKNSESNPNTAKITVYNLSESHRDFAETAELHILLRVGYLGTQNQNTVKELPIFTGNVKRVMVEKSGSDFLTIFECGDGERIIQELNFNKTYTKPKGKDLSANKIMEELANATGLPISMKGIFDVKFKHPITLSGSVKKHLDDLVALTGVEWSIQDETVKIQPKTFVNKNEFVLLTPETGLIGTPIKREIDLGKIKVGKVKLELPKKPSTSKRPRKKKIKEQTKFNGIEFTSLLNPLIAPTRTIEIRTEINQSPSFTEGPNQIQSSNGRSSVNGFFVIKKAHYQGDTNEGEWTVKCEALFGSK